MTDGSLANEKQALRRAMVQLLEAVDGAARDNMSRAIRARALAHESVSAAGTLMLYAGMAREPDTLPLIEALIQRGARVCLPVVRSKALMEAVFIEDLASLKPGVMGILEPTGAEVCPPQDIDVILVPGVAFDAQGGRLGHGAGYYDRFLRGTRAVTMGLAFDRQVVERVPMGAHDVPIDYVATERMVYRRVKA